MTFPRRSHSRSIGRLVKDRRLAFHPLFLSFFLSSFSLPYPFFFFLLFHFSFFTSLFFFSLILYPFLLFLPIHSYFPTPSMFTEVRRLSERPFSQEIRERLDFESRNSSLSTPNKVITV